MMGPNAWLGYITTVLWFKIQYHHSTWFLLWGLTLLSRAPGLATAVSAARSSV